MRAISIRFRTSDHIYQHNIVANYYSHHTQAYNSLTAVLNQIFKKKYIS